MRIAFCFDLDGTLTSQEILPEIAKHVDLYEEIDLLTNITMQGLIPFQKSFKLRVKLLSTIPLQTVRESVNNIQINDLLRKFVQENRENCFIITGNLDVWIDDFIRKEFGCEYFSSLAKFSGERLESINKIIDKKDAVQSLRSKFDFIIAIGDGMNDCSMFDAADIGIAFGGVHDPVSSLLTMSDYITYDQSSLYTLLNSLKSHYNAN